MARTAYHDYLALARDTDIPYREAVAHWRYLRDDLDMSAREAYAFFGDEVEEAGLDEFNQGDLWDVDTSSDWWDDDWDAGVEFEITATTEGHTPRRG
jgi:hypothetical protein